MTTLRVYLRDTIGLSTNNRADALITHGLTNYDTLEEYDDDDVKTLIKGVRTNNTNPLIISALIEKRVRLMCYGARLYSMIGRDVNAANLSIRRLRELESHKTIVEDHKDPSEETPKVTKTFSISKALDILLNFLRSKLGVRGVALSYVIRDAGTPPPLSPLGTNLLYSDAAGSLMNELIIHTPHTGVGWDEDNASVFGILQEMVRESPMASSLKQHQRQRDGRNAYLSLESRLTEFGMEETAVTR